MLHALYLWLLNHGCHPSKICSYDTQAIAFKITKKIYNFVAVISTMCHFLSNTPIFVTAASHDYTVDFITLGYPIHSGHWRNYSE